MADYYRQILEEALGRRGGGQTAAVPLTGAAALRALSRRSAASMTPAPAMESPAVDDEDAYQRLIREALIPSPGAARPLPQTGAASLRQMLTEEAVPQPTQPAAPVQAQPPAPRSIPGPEELQSVVDQAVAAGMNPRTASSASPAFDQFLYDQMKRRNQYRIAHQHRDDAPYNVSLQLGKSPQHIDYYAPGKARVYGPSHPVAKAVRRNNRALASGGLESDDPRARAQASEALFRQMMDQGMAPARAAQQSGIRTSEGARSAATREEQRLDALRQELEAISSGVSPQQILEAKTAQVLETLQAGDEDEAIRMLVSDQKLVDAFSQQYKSPLLREMLPVKFQRVLYPDDRPRVKRGW